MLQRTKAYIDSLRERQNLYVFSVCALGVALFAAFVNAPSFSLNEWVLLYALVASVVVLNHLDFQLPPSGTKQSMDSAVILAALFVHGLDIALYVLLFSYGILAAIRREVVLWKHLANFSMYVIMIVATSGVFAWAGGRFGTLQVTSVYIYLLALAVYFFVNTSIFGGFHVIQGKPAIKVFNGVFKESISAYASTLLLSLVLTMLFERSPFFGLFLFMAIAVLISKSFKLLFELYHSLSERAIIDQRTGLYNHSYFEEALESRLNASKKTGDVFSLVLLDLDNFKKYNDVYGHLKGDQLLEFFGAQLKRLCDRDGVVVARYGGEEFTVILPNVGAEEALSYANHIRKRINDTYFEGVELFPHGCLSFSAGVVQYTLDIYDKNQLVDRADQAMYYAKAQGKNVVHIYNEDSILQRTLDIEQDIREIEQQLNIFLSKDVYTFQHSKRVYRYAMELSDRLSLTDAEKKTLVLGALIHDIGKLEIPRDVLNKKGKLTNEEWEMVKKHVLWGKEIASTNEKFKPLLPLIELHHERYDGKGYPRGLKGEEIPKLARALCVIDSFDAMTTERPYQRTKTFQEAIVELRAHAGKQFDPEFAEAFIAMIERGSFDWSEDEERDGTDTTSTNPAAG
ncbi:diguanylate cyclase [Paenibacillus sp.]|uniref:bifunctional diguanylate cyclase/phosphohydrolase n=1 Tax=Paenibacillus sp. TaxID=58172 RepID=UPI00281103E9|nr:diguanylate cyclase [Paenibacillus sp.]